MFWSDITNLVSHNENLFQAYEIVHCIFIRGSFGCDLAVTPTNWQVPEVPAPRYSVMGKIQDGVKLVSGMGWGAKGEMKNEDAITVVGRDAGGALASSESFMAPNVAQLSTTSRPFLIPSYQFTFTPFSIDAMSGNWQHSQDFCTIPHNNGSVLRRQEFFTVLLYTGCPRKRIHYW